MRAEHRARMTFQHQCMHVLRSSCVCLFRLRRTEGAKTAAQWALVRLCSTIGRERLRDDHRQLCDDPTIMGITIDRTQSVWNLTRVYSLQ